MWDAVQKIADAVVDRDALRMASRIFTEGVWEETSHYAVIGLIVWGLLHVALRGRLAGRLIGEWPRAIDVRRDLAYSVGTIAVFASLNVLVIAMVITHRAHIYVHPLAHGLPWLLLSLPALIVWQDFYFYWTHRALHTRWLFQHVHGVHHRSRHPSPWSAYAFHPIEALNYSATLVIALAVVPINEIVLTAFVLHMIIRNTHGHAAVETMPKRFAVHRFWGKFTTTTHHHLHHEYAQGNFGLWFTWWDRLCKTERPDYLSRFAAATGSAQARLSAPADEQAECSRNGLPTTTALGPAEP